MASDLARVTCLVSKQTEPGPRQLDFSLLLNHNGLGSCVTRNGGVKVQGRLKLEDCVHSGPQMWPELVQRVMWPARLPVLTSDFSLYLALPPTMPISSLLFSSESPHPEVLCCLFCPHPTRPDPEINPFPTRGCMGPSL